MPTCAYIPGFQLILASQSPRRRDLLTLAGLPHQVRPSDIPEVPAHGESAIDYVRRLAHQKALAIEAERHEGILAADTTVAVSIDGTEHILEKPVDASDARRMLRLLSGRQHRVHTGICLLFRQAPALHVETTQVTFATLSEREIDAYMETGEPFGKAGAYAIQGLGSRFVQEIHGCYFNIVGLPVHRTYSMLRDANVLI